MGVDNITEFVEGIIQKFSKFILEFRNTDEFIRHIRTSGYKINGFGLNDWLPLEYQDSVYNITFYSDKNERIENKKFKTLSAFYYIARYLKSKSEKVGFFPLDKFIGRTKSLSYKKNLFFDDRIDLNDLINDMKKSGNFFIYWNRETMVPKNIIKKLEEEQKWNSEAAKWRSKYKKLSKIERKRYDELIKKASEIYNKNVWGDPNRIVPLVGVTAGEKGLSITIDIKNRIKSVKTNEYGQIKGYGEIINPYDNEEIPKKKIKDLNEVIKILRKAIKIAPDRGSPYKFIGRTYDYLTLYDEAIKYYKKAIELNPYSYKEELSSRIKECLQKKRGKTYLVVEKTENI